MGADKGVHVSDDEELDEEPGEEIESAPPMKVGEMREIGNSGLKKKLLKRGHGWETPEALDLVTVHCEGILLDGTKFESTRDKNEPLTISLTDGHLATGLKDGIITMKKGECALFTLPPELGFGDEGRDGVPPNSVIQFEVELISWITVVDICNDGGIIKKIMVKGERNDRPSDRDEVLVKYQVALDDGSIVAKTPEEGIEFYVNNGHLCPGLPKAITTMKQGERAKLIIQPQYAFGDDGMEGKNGIDKVPPKSVLNMDLELVSFKPVVDVTGDAKVLKKIIKEGEGAVVANEGAIVTIRYIAKLEDGTVFEKKGVDGEPPLEFITDEEQVISGLDQAAVTMKKGEQAVITMNSDYGFGNVEVKRDLAIVPPCSNLIYEVEMLDFIKEKTPWEMSNQEKLEACGRKKEEGNLFFKSEKYQRAAKKYNQAGEYVSEEKSFGDLEQNQAKALRVSCWLNAAACNLKLNNFQEALSLCSKVLEIEFQNVKALYRRAQAFIETGDLILARRDIKNALEIDPHNKEVKSLQKTLRQLQAENDKRDAKLYSNMFSRRTKDSTIAKKLKIEKKVEEEIAIELEKVVDSSAPSDNRMVVDS